MIWVLEDRYEPPLSIDIKKVPVALCLKSQWRFNDIIVKKQTNTQTNKNKNKTKPKNKKKKQNKKKKKQILQIFTENITRGQNSMFGGKLTWQVIKNVSYMDEFYSP